MKHEFDSKSAKQAQEKGLKVRREKAVIRAKAKADALDLIKTKSMEELITLFDIEVNINNELKQELYSYLMKSLIDVEVVEKAKHRFKTEQLFTKAELDRELKEQPEKTELSLSGGEAMSVYEAVRSGVIDESRISIDDVNMLRMFVS